MTRTPTGLSPSSAKWYRDCCQQFRFRTAGELEVLAQAAHALTRIAECQQTLKKDGAFIIGSKGLVCHPAARMELQNRALFLAAARQLGISNPKQGELDDQTA